MEIKAIDIRKGIITLAVATIFGAMFYSCSSQRGLAQVTTVDTMLVPKEWRPSTLALKAQQQPAQEPKPKSPERIKFENDLYSLVSKANSKIDKLDKIDEMQSALLMMSQNMVLMQARYRNVSIEKDSMLKAIRSDNTKMYEYLVTETTRRKEAELKEADTRKNSVIIQDWNDRIVLWCLIGIIALNLLNLFYKSQSRKQLNIT